MGDSNIETQITIVEDELVLVKKSAASNNKRAVVEKKFSGFADIVPAIKPSIETGIIPPFLASYRAAEEHEQFVLFLPPAINPILWAPREHHDTIQYNLAQPWRIVIGDFEAGRFLGARVFYSPYMPFDESAPLYHTNLPNSNVRGYNSGVAVGWVCLYHHGNQSKMSIAQKAAYLGHRVSGNEAVNDANMYTTDGTRWYKENFPNNPELWDGNAWEKKSLKEGYQWICDEKLLLPVKVTGAESQYAHNPSGVPLTLGMAMRGTYKAYYTDGFPNKPFNKTNSHKDKNSFNKSMMKRIVNQLQVTRHKSMKSYQESTGYYTFADNPLTTQLTSSQQWNVNALLEAPVEEYTLPIEPLIHFTCHGCQKIYSVSEDEYNKLADVYSLDTTSWYKNSKAFTPFAQNMPSVSIFSGEKSCIESSYRLFKRSKICSSCSSQINPESRTCIVCKRLFAFTEAKNMTTVAGNKILKPDFNSSDPTTNFETIQLNPNTTYRVCHNCSSFCYNICRTDNCMTIMSSHISKLTPNYSGSRFECPEHHQKFHHCHACNQPFDDTIHIDIDNIGITGRFMIVSGHYPIYDPENDFSGQNSFIGNVPIGCTRHGLYSAETSDGN